MIMSQKARYAVRAVLELSRREGTGPVKAAEIAKAQQIPVRFLENILWQLRSMGVLKSLRGKDGGYLLVKKSADLSVGELVRAIQGPVFAADCLDASRGVECALKSSCVLLPVWERGHKAMMDVYDSTSFQDLLERGFAAYEKGSIDYSI